ncbi:hypothetical protein [Streptomyces barringtoniae]|uniref:hypothetical protein n=1 Tax=Streptomyces barringtoniae TaxID=2892029 RepID=UPI001E3B9C52|nr:hypothetical protein [Streptomyces barringtoniae]MCC5480876.1 hypothetical protein [Streptomyces barringtoniae]
MALTRPAPHAGRPLTTPTSSPPADEQAGAARCAARLEALLGDPRDPGNPYGRSALWAAGHDGLPAPPAGLPGAGEVPAADQLARALRPLFRRDLALAHAWSIRPLLGTPVPHPAAALLGPAALLASAGGVLRGVARIVDGLSRYEAAARQWRPILASGFADLLACESLTAVALRSCSWPGPDADGPGTSEQGAGESLAAVVGYLVPELVGELLGDLELVLNECGFDAGTVERRTLARVVRDRAFARADWPAASAAQTRIVQGLSAAGGSRPDDGRQLAVLFRITEAASAVAPGADCPWAVAATLAGATARLAGADDADTAALARIGRRLVTEQRALRVACAATTVHDPADPAARALANRQALLVLAAATLGVREAAAGARLPFLGGAGWALLALGRITERLGQPLPDRTPDPQPGVWDELARRASDGVDCDLHATRLLW